MCHTQLEARVVCGVAVGALTLLSWLMTHQDPDEIEARERAEERAARQRAAASASATAPSTTPAAVAVPAVATKQKVKAVYTHGDGRPEVVTIVKRHSDGEQKKLKHLHFRSQDFTLWKH